MTLKYAGYGQTYQNARKHLETRLSKKDFDHQGTLKEIVEIFDDWIKETYADSDIPPFLLEFDEKTNSIIICRFQKYIILNVSEVKE